MRFGDILADPAIYMVLLFTIAGAYYAKGNLVDAIMLGFPAPLILVPVWIASLFASLIVIIPIKKMAPSLYSEIAENFHSWPTAVQFMTNPANVITFSLFAFYCHYERKNRGLPSGYVARGSQSGSANPYSRSIRK